MYAREVRGARAFAESENVGGARVLDRLTICAYIVQRMRRLFAFLALLTGLTAIGASAQANVISASALEVAVAAATLGDKRKQAECPIARKTQTNRAESSKDCKEFRPVVIVIPTVQFGADRAFE